MQPSDSQKKIVAEFFQTPAGHEPVREAIKALGRPASVEIGGDIRFVEQNWRVDKPYVDRLRSGKGAMQKTIYEVRHTVERKEYRTLFFVYGRRMMLTHFIQKTSQKTPKPAIDLTWDRMRAWMAKQLLLEAKTRRGEQEK